MEEFLVLGIVPNTDIQIGFVGWLVAVQLLLLILLVTKLFLAKLPKIHAAHLHRKVLHLLTIHNLL